MNAETTIIAIVVLYMLILLSIGYLASRWTRSPADFFLAGRSLGSWVTAISSTASSESGWVVLGTVGMAYTQGVSALWYAPGCLLGYWVNLYWLAPRLRRAAARHGSLTLSDFLADRFGHRYHAIRVVSVLIILLCLAGYLAAQMTATGKAMQAILGVSYLQGVFWGGLVIVVYTLLGGFRAVCWTDLVQGVVMALSLVVMPLLVVTSVGGYGAMLDGLFALDANLVTVSGGRSGFALLGFVVGLLGIGLGYPGQPHVIIRYMAAADDATIRRTQLIAMSWGVIVFYGSGFLGLAGRLIMPELAAPGGDPEQLFPLLAPRMLHPVIAGIMLAAILSAIMSTMSSQLLVVASAVSHDLVERVLQVTRSARGAVLSARIAVVVVGVLAMLVAGSDVRAVFWFVLFAWSGLGAAFGPILLLSFTRQRVTPAGALAGMITGFIVTVLWKQTGLSDSVIYELVPAFLLATVMVLIVSRQPALAPAKE